MEQGWNIHCEEIRRHTTKERWSLMKRRNRPGQAAVRRGDEASGRQAIDRSLLGFTNTKTDLMIL